MNNDKEIILEVANSIKAKGYKVYLAKEGTYGFYTTTDGLKVVCFSVGLGGVKVSGSYKTNKPRKTGNGWRMSDSFRFSDIDSYIKEPAPSWAVGDSKVHYLSEQEYLEKYNESSKFYEH